MGHNRAGENGKKRKNRRQKYQRWLKSLWPAKDVHVYYCRYWGCLRMSLRKDNRWIDFGKADNTKRRFPERYCTARVWYGLKFNPHGRPLPPIAEGNTHKGDDRDGPQTMETRPG